MDHNSTLQTIEQVYQEETALTTAGGYSAQTQPYV